jgi:hypothetical protein
VDPTVTFDLVHAELSLGELAALAAKIYGLLESGFCALVPFC